jgi:hypothetical protein
MIRWWVVEYRHFWKQSALISLIPGLDCARRESAELKIETWNHWIPAALLL